jgi:hypothetical protein
MHKVYHNEYISNTKLKPNQTKSDIILARIPISQNFSLLYIKIKDERKGKVKKDKRKHEDLCVGFCKDCYFHKGGEGLWKIRIFLL